MNPTEIVLALALCAVSIAAMVLSHIENKNLVSTFKDVAGRAIPSWDGPADLSPHSAPPGGEQDLAASASVAVENERNRFQPDEDEDEENPE